MIAGSDQIPELLAPAGSPEAFLAALESGADAIYLGLDSFNARLRARNFTQARLTELIPLARESGCRVYITINTLIQQQEIEAALELAWQVQTLGVAAVIIQDLGLARLISRHLPGLAMHASTQLAAHNLEGVETLSQLGFSRVILARELSLREIRQITQSAPVETEVFIHGAVCYGVSGLCLASSALGGASGNRGRCTQVCRREFSSESTVLQPFSPGDFCAADSLGALISTGVSCLKIEGRMRSAEYVSHVTSAWRELLDGGEVEPLRQRLREDFGRPQHRFFLDDKPASDLLLPVGHPGTGIRLGVVRERSGKIIQMDWAFDLNPRETLRRGDRVRLQRNDEDGDSLRVEAVRTTTDGITLQLDQHLAEPGDVVYLVGREVKRRRMPAPGGRRKLPGRYPRVDLLKRDIIPPVARPGAELLEIRCDTYHWLEIARDLAERWILDLSRDELPDLLHMLQNNPQLVETISVALPAVIFPDDLPGWKDAVRQLADAGVRRLLCGNVGHLPLLDKRLQGEADATLWCLNGASAQTLRDLNLDPLYFSPEDDTLNLRRLSRINARLTVYGRPLLFISRIPPALADRQRLEDREGRGFIPSQRNGLFLLHGETPRAIFQRQRKLREMGCRRFVIDLAATVPDRQQLESLLADWAAARKCPGSYEMNFKTGLK